MSNKSTHRVENYVFSYFFPTFCEIMNLMNYHIGDKVIHCRNGVSAITGKREMGDREYFVINAIRGDGENIYVPVVGHENIVRPVMGKEEADELLHNLASVEKEFNPNTKQRRDAYKRRLSSGCVEDIAFLYRQQWLYEKYPEGVKLGPSDIEMLQYATNILLDELAITYEVDRDEVAELVESKIK